MWSCSLKILAYYFHDCFVIGKPVEHLIDAGNSACTISEEYARSAL